MSATTNQITIDNTTCPTCEARIGEPCFDEKGALLDQLHPRIEVPEEELLPCPFCGGTKIDSHEWASNDGRSGPGCHDCGALGESAAAWNRRVPQPAQPIAVQDERALATEIARYCENTFTSEDGGSFESVVDNIEEMLTEARAGPKGIEMTTDDTCVAVTTRE